MFVGKYGKRYEICTECEEVMDTFLSGDFESERTAAAKKLYDCLFAENDPKSPELLSFFKDLFSENGKTLLEAQESLREYEEELRESHEEDAPVTPPVDDSLPTEEEFLRDREKPMSIWAKLLLLLLYLLLGGGAIWFGIIRSTVALIVAGSLIALIGVFMSFSK